MARNFSDIVADKSDDELAEMQHQLNSFVPFKQRIILAEFEARETRSRQDAIIREQARAVTRETLEDWFCQNFSEQADEQTSEQTIATTLGRLVDAGKLEIPRGGYLVTHTKKGINVRPASKKQKRVRKKPGKTT